MLVAHRIRLDPNNVQATYLSTHPKFIVNLLPKPLIKD
jgi:hypothetical protein